MTTEIWAHVGEPTGPPAGFYASDADLPFGLPPEQVQTLRSLEFAERQEEQRRQAELAERMEQSHNRAVMEAITRAHAAGEQWNPADPWKHYPSREQRVSEAFAVMDMQAASELRQAKAAAARVLREHGVHAQIVIDANATESPHPASAGSSDPPASRALSLSSSMPVAAARATLIDKIRGARHRWASPKMGHRSVPGTGCGCAACRANATVRSNAGSRPLNGPDTVRYR